MAKKEKKVDGFILVNAEKVNRALYGAPNRDGGSIGGIAKPDGSYDRQALLVEYDRLGGLIRKGSDKVKTGSFYDFKKKQPFAKPQVVFTYRINGQTVDVPEGKELPGIVKAVKVLADAAKKGKKVKDEEEEEEEEEPEEEDVDE